MVKAGKPIVLIYAFVMLFGGIMGFVTKHSVPSLVSGVLSAIFLGAGYSMLANSPKKGFALSLLVALVLAGVFILRSVQTAGDPKSLGRNIGLTVLSLAAAALFGKCAQETA